MIDTTCLYSDAASSAVASFSDGRCEADGVCPNDPLLFTYELNEAVLRALVSIILLVSYSTYTT